MFAKERKKKTSKIPYKSTYRDYDGDIVLKNPSLIDLKRERSNKVIIEYTHENRKCHIELPFVDNKTAESFVVNARYEYSLAKDKNNFNLYISKEMLVNPDITHEIIYDPEKLDDHLNRSHGWKINISKYRQNDGTFKHPARLKFNKNDIVNYTYDMDKLVFNLFVIVDEKVVQYMYKLRSKKVEKSILKRVKSILEQTENNQFKINKEEIG